MSPRLVTAAFFALCTCGSATAATTTYDSNGTVLVDGIKTFLVGVNRPPPVGGTTPTGADALGEIVGDGVNVLVVGPSDTSWSGRAVMNAREWDAVADAVGAYTSINLRTLALARPGTARETTLRNVVAALKDDPGLAMWKGADEPWWSGQPPSLLRHAYNLTKSIDGEHLWSVVEAPRGLASDLAPYSRVTDAHSVDIYPVVYGVRDPDLHQVGRWTRLIRSVSPKRVVFTTLQVCFSGSLDPHGSGAYVLPTMRQERYMVYDAILNGARGLFFYDGGSRSCLSPRDRPHGWNWTFWNRVLSRIVREIGPDSELYPALVNAGLRVRAHADDLTTQVLARRGDDADIWVMAARYGGGLRRVRIAGLPKTIARGDVYWEGRTVRVRDGAFTDRFARWSVHVYHFAPQAPTGLAYLGGRLERAIREAMRGIAIGKTSRPTIASSPAAASTRPYRKPAGR